MGGRHREAIHFRKPEVTNAGLRVGMSLLNSWIKKKIIEIFNKNETLLSSSLLF